ncbi:MAG TPA: hypothetical protein VEW93_02380 [Acidimicrobiales bacterium]|nr:hypothetical protein [Acidimicrobiales bacterium]
MGQGPTEPEDRHPVRALWAVPRSASTAFERMMIERGDHAVLDEPFSAVYYHGPDRRSPRFPETEPDATVPAIIAEVEALAASGPVFVKDMAYHPGPALDALLGAWNSTFLIRDPRWSIPSMARIWPDMTDEEAGFTALSRAVETLRAAGTEPLVIDSHDLCREPEAVVGAWCDTMGLAAAPDALTWESGMRPEWERWRDWYGATSRSSGFLAPPDGSPPAPQDARIAALVERNLPVYEELRTACLVP